MRSQRLFQLAWMILLCVGQLYSQWTPVSQVPGGIVCAVQCVGDTLIVGLAGSEWGGRQNTGIYQSTDLGTSWRLMGLKDIPVVSLAQSGPYLFAGTWYSGIFRSSDGGVTWEQKLSDLIVGPLIADDSVVYAGTNGSGVAFSADHGTTWVFGTPNTWAMNGLAVAGPYVFALQTSSFPFLHRAARYPSGWGSVSSPADSQDFVQLAASDSVLFLSTFHGLFSSTDYGGTWAKSDSGLPKDEVVSAFCVFQKGIIVLVGGDLYRSIDVGASWHFWAHAPQDVALTAFSGGKSLLVLGSAGAGVYVSADKGITWDEAGTIIPGIPVSLLSRGGDLLMGASTGGVYRSIDDGEHWVQARAGMKNAGRCILAGSPSTIFAANNRSSWCAYYNFYYNASSRDPAPAVLRSSDEGRTWEGIVGGGQEGWMAFAAGDWLFVRSGGCGMMGCTDDPFVSTDGGRTWTPADTVLNSCQAFSATDSIIFAGGGPSPYAGGIRPQLSSHIWGAFRSTDKGQKWERTNFPFQRVTALAAGGSQLAVASKWVDTLAYGSHPEFHVSSDLGNSWVKVTAGILGEGRSLCWIGSNLMAATTAGVFRLRSGGTLWSPLNVGLGDSSVSSLTVHGDKLFVVGSSGRVWHRPITELTRVADTRAVVPHRYFLEQNYPNPFNPTTTIRYTIAGVVAPSGASLSGVEGRVNNVRLVVYDVLGREVATLVNEVKEPGTYTVQWDASGYANGVYLCRMSAGSFVDVKKLILLR